MMTPGLHLLPRIYYDENMPCALCHTPIKKLYVCLLDFRKGFGEGL